jgi:acyl transferase domain-containing protein/thioesterase domain-containing protein/NAD(P)-dependent dehydrogenase (short-subunit alcohol dehydrogenase family)
VKGDVERVLRLVREQSISAAEGRRRLEELRAAGAPRPDGAAEARPGADPTARRTAVIGMSCHFSSGRSPAQLWRTLAEGRSTIREVPPERWDAASFFDVDARTPGHTNSRWGGFLTDADEFDPLFFNLSGAEAEQMDPQQRLFLQCSWAALEDAGYCGPGIRGSSCGVFAGAPASDYPVDNDLGDPYSDVHVLTGNDTAFLASRISYLLDLHGPSMSLNTACSSSLVAVHLACQAIASGECETALAGGVCLFVGPGFYLSASNGGMLSPTGLCRTFDRTADGFVPGEGAGLVVLKDFDAAVRDGDTIRGVILGGAVNQDGKTNGITAPSSRSQTAVQLAAYRKAGISPDAIDFVEAHGTGTKLGDPIEIDALTRAFSEYTSRRQYCAIGSVKTNLGHTGQAAGIAGLIKVLLAFEHETIPPNLHFKTANEQISFADTPFYVPTAPVGWPRRPDRPRLAAVSSFGYSGTNAHLVVQEPPKQVPAAASGAPRLIPVSAKTREALAERISDLRSWLDGDGAACGLTDIAFTLLVGRAHFPERAAFAVRGPQELRDALDAWTDQGRSPADPAASPRDELAAVHRRIAAAGDDADAALVGLAEAARLYEQGAVADADVLFSGARPGRIPMPTYPFAREKYWNRPAPADAAVPPEPEPAADSSRAETGGTPPFSFQPDVDDPAIAGHVVLGRPILAAAWSLALAREGARRAGRAELTRIEGVRWLRPLPVGGGAAVEVRYRPEAQGLRFEIDLADSGRTQPAVEGVLLPSGAPDTPLEPKAGGRTVGGGECYRRFREYGFDYGPAYRVLRRVQLGAGWAGAELAPVAEAGFEIDPLLLDGALQTLFALGLDDDAEVGVPYALRSCELHAPLAAARRSRLRSGPDGTADLELTDEEGRVLISLRGLTVAQGPDAGELLRFEPAWVSAPRPTAAAIGPALVVDLSGGPAAVPPAAVLAVPGDAFARTASGGYTIDPQSQDDYRRLLAAVSPATVVLLTGPARGRGDLVPFHAASALCRALMDARLAEPVGVRIGYPGRGADDEPALAALGAFARSVRLENPDLRCQTVALADGPDWQVLLAAASAAEPVELRVAGGEVAALRLRELPAAPAAAPIPHAGRTYLVTGGTGYLGSLVASRLAGRGANVVVVGRTAPADPVDDSARISYERADAADEAAMAEVLRRVRSRFGALHGVVHASGVVHDGLLRAKVRADVDAVLRAKVEGALVIERLTRDDPLEFVAYFSSVAAVTGNAGQTDYAYANAFLDALARRRAARGGPGATVAIGWPAWADGGMAREAVHEAGVSALGRAEGLAAFEAALGWGVPHVVLAHGDPAAVRALLVPDEAGAVPVAESEDRDAAGETAAATRDEVVSVLTERLAQELRIPAARIDPGAALEIYGIDSVMVMQLSKRLEPDFGELPKTAFFEYRTLNDLAGYIAARSAAALARRVRPAVGPPPAVVVDRVTDTVTSRAEVGAAPAEPGAQAGYDIAVIGLAGRYPMAGDLAGFWRNLKDGRDCVTEIPAGRWPLDGFYDPDRVPGRSYSKWGGFLDDVECFDPLFFNISPKESDMMDPQERLFLETVWHVLEDAGYSRSGLAGTAVGVFVGVMYGQYELLPMAPDGRVGVSSYASIANRASYHLDFRGPSIALDTMCSSSLTAVHLACASIARGECEAAVAGGVNVSVHPRKYLQLSLAEFMSSDGRCRSFGAGGDGYVPGEGVGAVLLKPLAKALADGDHVRAVIRGSAINHGGRTNGYTVPDPRAQAAAIGAALRVGGVAAGDLGYIEAHGTGTALGDPIEIAALGRALAGDPVGRESIPIGSVKSNIGHLESAAGIAAITKVILQMEHRTLVPSLHAAAPNPEIDFADTPFRIQREAAAWQPGSGRLVAGISSFGAGGSNAHLVLEAVDAPAPPPDPAGDQIIALCAKSPEQLVEAARLLAAHLDGFAPADAAPDPGRLDRELLDHVQQLLGVGPDDLGVDDPLDDCGFDAAARSVLDGWLVRRYGLPQPGLPETLTTVARMADWLRARVDGAPAGRDGHSAAPRLADIAFTLQTGREPMPVRLAFAAADLRGAVRILTAFAAGEDVPEARLGGFGPASEDRTTVDLSDEAGRQYLRSVTEQGRLDRVAALWAAGASIDWELLHADGPRRRVPLPGYPFARERHWLPVGESAVEPVIEQAAAPAPAPPARIDVAPAPERQEAEADAEPWLRALLTDAVADLIGAAPARIDPKGKFNDYGLESVTLKQLAVRASEQLGVMVSPAMFFDRPSVADAAAWILEEHPAAVLRAHHGALAADRPQTQSIDSPLREEGRPSVTELQPTPVDAADQAPPRGHEPIAVIGMSARFPGSPDPLRFWDNLLERRNLVAEVPADRWDWREQGAQVPPEHREALRWGGFIDDVDAFDAAFFGITPAEAEGMDPQQRILLQLVWAALEDAGYRPSALAGRRVGLFAGIQFSDYQHLLHEAGVFNTYAGLGNEHAIALNRVSYLLDFRGPSEPVNTACSSSLVAVHRAIRSLRDAESEVAVVGGIGLNLAPYSAVADALLGVMSADGATRTLDRDANGFVKGEGAGVLVLKPLSKALADADHVYAVIRGSAVNHGGRAASLTAPRAEAQADVIKDAVRDADVDPGTIGYLEMHGTATELGDPVEVSGIKQAFRQLYRERGTAAPAEPRTGLGSVKTNVGHLEPASGMAGLIKLVLSLSHRTIPGMAHFREANPYVDLEGSPFFIADRTVPWPQPTGADARPAPRRGAVSAFGFGGVNAHVVVEESPQSQSPARGAEASGDRVFLFSAKTAAALDRTVRNFLAWLEDGAGASSAPPDADDVAFTLREGREEFAERLAVVAPGLEVLRERLRSARDAGVYEPPVFRGGSRQAPAAAAPPEGERDPRVLAAAWVGGSAVDWRPRAEGRPRRVALPTYPFALDRFWFEAPTPKESPVPVARAVVAEPAEPAAQIAPEPVATDVYYRILELFSERLRIPEDELDPDRPFRELGVDSLLSVGITQELQQIYGSTVPFAALADHPTIRGLAEHIEAMVSGPVPAPAAARPAQERREPVVTRSLPERPAVRPSPGREPLRPARPERRDQPPARLPAEIVPLNGTGGKQASFWVPGADGYAASLANLSVGLGPDYPVYAFQTRGTDGTSMPQRMDDMLDTYVSCIRAVQPHGPYVLGGYSFGGLTAIELARRLHEEGESIKHLVLFDTYPATQKVFDLHKETYDYDFIPFYMANVFLDLAANPELAIRQEELEHLPRELLLIELAWIAKERGRKRIAVDDIYRFLRGGTVCADHSAGLYQMYKMRYYDASDVLFFKALDGFTGKSSAIYWPASNIMKDYDYVTPWHEYFGTEMRLVELANDHLNMLQEPTLSRVVQALLPALGD